MAFKNSKAPQKAIAKSLGVTARTIRYWKTGQKIASKIHSQKISKRVSYYKSHRVIHKVAKGYRVDKYTGEKIESYVSSDYYRLGDKDKSEEQLHEKLENPQTDTDGLTVLLKEEFIVKTTKR